MNSARLKKWTTDDVLMQLREEHNLGSTKPFFFMSHNPVLCGVMQCATLLKSQSECISITNALLYAACAAHLYNPAMNEGHLQHHWPDMEKLIDLYGRSDIFRGAPPKTISAYCNHHLISRGCSVRNFANNKWQEVVKSEIRYVLMSCCIQDKEMLPIQSTMALDPHKALNRFKAIELGLSCSSNALGHYEYDTALQPQCIPASHPMWSPETSTRAPSSTTTQIG